MQLSPAAAKMSRELALAMGRPEAVVVEIALTRMHQQMFPAQYELGADEEFAAVGVPNRSLAAFQLSEPGSGDSTIADWLVAAKLAHPTPLETT